MSDGIVILGTVAIVGLVAVVTVALVYNRIIWVRGTRDSVEVQTQANVAERHSSIENGIGNLQK